MKNKILVLIGESSTGKSEIEKRLVEKGLKKVVSFTTRKARVGELNGIDYHFITNEDFFEMDKNNEFVEKTHYRVKDEDWNYGFSKKGFESDENLVVVINPHGLEQLLQYEWLSKRILIFKIESGLDTRIFRYLQREKNGNKTELELYKTLIDRLCVDYKDFSKESLDFIEDYNCGYNEISNNGVFKKELDNVVDEILEIVEEYEEFSEEVKKEFNENEKE